MIYKIVDRKTWDAACRKGEFAGSADDNRDGFIHLSAAHQVRGTAERHFKGVGDLVLVAFDETALGAALKWEPSRGGDLFPHLYGSLPTGLALSVSPLPLGEGWLPQVPAELP